MKKYKGYSLRQIVISSSLLLITSVIVAFVLFSKLYNLSRTNIISVWESATIQTARDVKFYLTMPMDAVAFSAVTLNNMLDEGASHEEAGQYLISETNIYSSIISENNTGIYAYYDGEYLDGSGWVCPDDYEPTERPWYTEAIKNEGKITLVQPFLNLQTNTVMMSVCQMLNDGMSVVSMDIFLDSVQGMVEETAANKDIVASFVIDNSGLIVAHSDESKVGENFETGNTTDREILDKIRRNQQGIFDLNKSQYILIIQQINNDWSTGLLIDRESVFSPLKTIFFAFAIILVLLVAVLLSISIFIYKKAHESYVFSSEVRAVADIYRAMLRVNLHADTMSVVLTNPELEPLWEGKGKHFSTRIDEAVRILSSELFSDIMLKFLDLSTLNERMVGVNSISQEFVDSHDEWNRVQIIVVERDEAGHLSKILITLESIDEDKKRQENLKKLSETDLMTGIMNRGSGENAVRNVTAQGIRGMFCLIDVDNFKTVNDNYGHGTGDKVLIGIADCLTRACRDTDIVFRLGGDEFAIFLKNVDSSDMGKIVLTRFLEYLKSLNIPELEGFAITVSIGATFYLQDDNDSFENLYKRADQATYISKKSRDNRITFI